MRGPISAVEAMFLVILASLSFAVGTWVGEEDARDLQHRMDQAWALGISVGERCNDLVRPANVTWSDCADIVTGENVLMASTTPTATEPEVRS